MKHPCLASLLALTFPFLTANAADSAKWKLVWSDEFQTAGLPDTNKWVYETGFVRNNESQYYTPSRRENARVENGTLIIEARKERFKNERYDPASATTSRGRRGQEFAEYTSASLTTRGKADWTYGRIEVKAKLPKGRGTWPAIWLLGTDRSAGWPACGEIDVMEFVGHEPGVVHANVHTAKYNHIKGNNKGDKVSLPDASDQFHVYVVEWDSKRMDFFVDDRKYFTYENEGTGVDAWPFDKPEYLILNLAIGGAWGGQKGIDDTIFPQQFIIDYVRVFRPSP